jgi:hypothetical protein
MLYERYFVKHVGSLGQVPEGAGAAMDPVSALLTSAPRGSAAAASIPPLRVAVSDNKKGSKGTTVAIQRQAFAEAGFRVYDGMPAAPSDYDILWEHHAPKAAVLSGLTPSHRVNLFPGMSILCQKAQFGKFAHEKRLEFVPRYYTSSERDAAYLVADLQVPTARFVLKNRSHRGVRMLAPAEVVSMAEGAAAAAAAKEAGGAARSIYGEAPEGSSAVASLLKEQVVQQFIQNALLVDGHKFDVSVYVFIQGFAPTLEAYTLENVLIRVVPRPFPTTAAEWSDNKRLIVQDEYLTAWNMPTFRQLWTNNARDAFDAYIRLMMHAEGSTDAESSIRLNSLWGRIRTMIWKTLSAVQHHVLNQSAKERKAGKTYSSYQFVRYDFLIDTDFQPWLLEINMSPNMQPHDGEAHYDTQWRLAVLREIAALIAGRPDLVPNAVRLAGPTNKGQVETNAYQVLRQLCLDDSVWRWSCELPVVMDIRHFHGDCACAGRLLLHKETGRYRCEALNEKCGGVSFEKTLGYPVDLRWYRPVPQNLTSHADKEDL